MTRPRSALTIVELLVTTALITILASLLLPGIGAARQEARCTACISRLRTIGQMMVMYAEDNDDRHPRGPVCGTDPVQRYNATNLLWMQGDHHTPQGQYLGLGLLSRSPTSRNNELFFCPADSQLDVRQQMTALEDRESNAYGSFLYRQTDAADERIVDTASLFKRGDVEFINGVTARYPNQEARRVDVDLLVLDRNYELSDVDETHARAGGFNHRGALANALYEDTHVERFSNQEQLLPEEYEMVAVPWATVPATAMVDTSLFVRHLDRIFIAGDFGLAFDPWTAPVPVTHPDYAVVPCCAE